MMTSPSPSLPSGPAQEGTKKDFWLVFLILTGLFTFALGLRPLATPDEGRYVEIPREMVERGDWLTPHLNGLPYFEKPPLVYWMEAAMIKGVGLESFFWLRFPIASFALLGCLFLYGFSRALGKNTMAFWAPLILGTSLLYCVLARLLILDLVFTVLMSGALLSFFLATQGHKRLLWVMSYGGGLALATLTKGLIGVVLPGGIILLWILIARQWSCFRVAFHPLALGVFLVIAAPWHIMVALENPEFFSFYFIHEHFLRYLTTEHNRYQPFWFFIPIAIVGFFPWVSFVPAIIKETRLGHLSLPDKLSSFLWIWILFVLGFFSFSSSKLIPYILPIFPPLSLLVAVLFTEGKFPSSAFKIYGTFTVLIGLAFVLYTPIDHFLMGAPYDFKTLMPLLVGGTLCLAGGLWSVFSFYKIQPQKAYFSILASFLSFLLMAALLDPHVQRTPSIRPMMWDLKSRLMPNDSVVLWGNYFQDIPVYLERTVQVVHNRGELDFGGLIRPHQDRLLTDEAFRALWESPTRVFVIASHKWRKTQGIRDLLSALPHVSVVRYDPPYIICTNRP